MRKVLGNLSKFSFNERVALLSRCDQATGCVNWIGSIGWTDRRPNVGGYPRMGVTIDGRRIVLAMHRWVWEQVNGPIPAGMMVCHKCDNRRCIRPSHLFLGTSGDNARDMARKGRSAQRRATNGILDAMRSEYVPGHPTQGARPLSIKYGFSYKYTRNLLCGFSTPVQLSPEAERALELARVDPIHRPAPWSLSKAEIRPQLDRLYVPPPPRKSRFTWVEFRGQRRKLFDLCREFGVRSDTIKKRIRNGMDLEAALTTPVARRLPHGLGRRLNPKAPRKTVSGHKGVTWSPVARRWIARAMVNGVRHFLGTFSEREEAIRARDEGLARLQRPASASILRAGPSHNGESAS